MNLKSRAAWGWCGVFLSAIAWLYFWGASREVRPLRIGLNSWPGYEFLYLAQVKGFYAQEGVRVQIIQCGSLTDSRRSYERGQLDGLGCTSVELIQATHGAGKKPKVVMVTDYSEGADVILAKPDISNVEGLRGKRVGLELASLGVYMLARALENKGMNLDDVIPVSVDQEEMEDMFLKGTLDAVVTYPPFSVSLREKAQVTEVFSTKEIPHEVVDMLVVDEEVIHRRPEDVKKLLRAFNRAVNYAHQHPTEAFEIMGSREGLTGEAFGKAFQSGIRIVSWEEQEDYLGDQGGLGKTLAHVEKVMEASGQIQHLQGNHSFVSRLVLQRDEGPLSVSARPRP